MKLVYVAHPYGGDPENLARARRWLAWLLGHPDFAGCGFVADWILTCELLVETVDNRSRGLEVDLELVRRCDVLVLVGGRVSPGMEQELLIARAHRKGIIDLTDLGPVPPPLPTVAA